MDTNAKKFKYSALNKIICALLCLITILGAAGVTSFGLASVTYCFDGAPESWTDSSEFSSFFQSGIDKILGAVTRETQTEDLRKELRAKKADAVEEALAQYTSTHKEIEKDAAEDGFNNLNDRDFAEYVNEYYYDEQNLTVYVETSFTTYEFSTEPYTNTTPENAEKYFSSQYDKFVNNTYTYSEEIYYDSYKYLPTSFYAKYKSNVVENLNSEEFSADKYTKSDCYFIYDDGKVSYKGISKDLADTIYNSYIKGNKYAKDVSLYTCIENNDSDTLLSFLDNGGNYFLDLEQFHEKGVNFYNRIIPYAVFDLILIIVSFVCAFYFFSITGRKREDGEVKLAFIDYVPFEIHLGVYIGLGFGAVMLYISMIDNLAGYLYSPLFTVLTVIIALALWLMLFEFSTSVVRYAKSDKKFYKNFLVYLILYVLFIVIKAWIKLDIKIFRKMKASAKKTWSVFFYKPHKFEKNAIALFILYCFANLILLTLIILAAFCHLPFTTTGIILIDLAGNFIVIRKILSYIKNLDVIIAASEKHEDINLDIESLPKSLEVLAQSMKYTNAELRDAVNQAVKDERLRTELITNVSHDLKTPLTSIITYVDLLSKCDIQDEKAQEYIKVLDEKGARLKRLIDDLVEASKVTSGNVQFNPVQLNLSELCLQSTVEVQGDFEKAGLDLIIKQGEISPTIFADGPKTFRIIENLLSNARKYSAKGTRVYASVYKEDKYGVFEIKNISAQPLDISPEELTERFVRGDKSRNQEGNGLGLSIAKELCKAQKGELEITIDGDLFKAKVKLPLV